jgi:hypothetical protein
MSSPVDIVLPLDPDPMKGGLSLQPYRYKVTLSPGLWGAYQQDVPLRWKRVKFEKSEQNKIPLDKNGVYSFVVESEIANHCANSYMFYVGQVNRKSGKLRARFLEYFRERDRDGASSYKREKVKRILESYRDHLWFYFAPIDEEDKIDSVEARLINAFVPWANTEGYQATLRASMNAFPD